jgi:hypothetical protein
MVSVDDVWLVEGHRGETGGSADRERHLVFVTRFVWSAGMLDQPLLRADTQPTVNVGRLRVLMWIVRAASDMMRACQG